MYADALELFLCKTYVCYYMCRTAFITVCSILAAPVLLFVPKGGNARAMYEEVLICATMRYKDRSLADTDDFKNDL